MLAEVNRNIISRTKMKSSGQQISHSQGSEFEAQLDEVI